LREWLLFRAFDFVGVAGLVGRHSCKVKLVNNGLVKATSGPLILQTNPKSGIGVWEAGPNGVLQVDAQLTNNGTVKATSGTVILANPNPNPNLPISGSGVWEATGPEGLLQVSSKVTGPGTWRVNDPEAEIRIDNQTCVTGALSMSAGTFSANQKFITTGNLGMTGGTIFVGVNSTARFSGPAGYCGGGGSN